MTNDQCREICRDRLDSWRDKLVGDHATPAVLIGIGQDHVSGQLYLCVPENFTLADIRTILIGVYRRLGGQS